MPPRSQRIPRGIPLALTLGFLTTIAIAWLIASFATYSASMTRSHDMHAFIRDPRAILIDVRVFSGFQIDAWCNPPLSDKYTPKFITAYNDLTKCPPPTDPTDAPSIGPITWAALFTSVPLTAESGSNCGFGWPCICLWYHHPMPVGTTADPIRGGLLLNFPVQSQPTTPSPSTSVAFGWWSRSPDEPRIRALPYLPIWPGLSLNLLLYSTLWWSILFTHTKLRTTLRHLRGHCPHCNYDLQSTHSRPCPECGKSPPTHNPSPQNQLPNLPNPQSAD